MKRKKSCTVGAGTRARKSPTDYAPQFKRKGRKPMAIRIETERRDRIGEWCCLGAGVLLYAFILHLLIKLI